MLHLRSGSPRTRAGWLATVLGLVVLQLAPVAIRPASALVQPMVSVSSDHACAVTSTATVECWGSNWYGQLGLGDDGPSSSNIPEEVPGLSGVVAVEVGYQFSCALIDDDNPATPGYGVKCWGYNSYGQLGNSTNNDSNTPSAVTYLSSGIAAISLGYAHACAVNTSGALFCWGLNTGGQLGTGNLTNRNVRTAVPGAGVVADVALGNFHTCVRMKDAPGAKCWGLNYDGQLGDGTGTARKLPVAVKGLGAISVAAIDAGSYHTCAVTAAGAEKCWGDNGEGQLGDGTRRSRSVPVQVSGLGSGVAAIGAGGYHSCAVTTAGAARCWGGNDSGQLGDGSVLGRLTPVQVAGLTAGTTFAISAGGVNTCAVSTRGAIRCWGSRSNGLVGDGTEAIRGFAMTVSGALPMVTSVAAGDSHTCAVSAGGVWCWGSNSYGQLGDSGASGPGSAVPVPVPGLASGVAEVAAGSDFTCARLTDGTVSCWGEGTYGQLGDGGDEESGVPVQVYGLANVVDIDAGGRQACAIVGDLGNPGAGGAVSCWGDNAEGQLGIGTLLSSLVPVEIDFDYEDDSAAVAVTVGAYHACSNHLSGYTWCWGNNDFGQLGDGTFTRRTSPTKIVTAGSTMAGDEHTCATVSQTVKCWGDNTYGQLGTGDTTPSNVPVSVTGLSDWTGLESLSVGPWSSCVVRSGTGTVRCWGDNTYGALGDGTVMEYSYDYGTEPVDVRKGLSPGGATLGGVARVSIGYGHACAADSAGAAWCWGQDYYGQLGRGGGSVVLPTLVAGWLYVPLPPTATSVAVTSTTGANIGFTAPVDNGGSAVTGYTATCTSSDGGATGIGTGGSSPVAVSALTTGKLYTCTVVATNAAGDSAPSAPGPQFIPAGLPTITSFTPTTGGVGTAVTITGTNFAPNPTCKFQGSATPTVTASVCAYISPTTIVTAVPPNAAAGFISVTTAAGKGDSSVPMSAALTASLPTITTFTPSGAAVGNLVTITGTNVGAATSVRVGTGGTVSSGWSVKAANQIQVAVPAGATSGTVSVTTQGGTATTTAILTVYVTPAVTSFTPTTSTAGLPITIAGTGFLGTSSVSFNGTTATPTTVTNTSISVTVPRGSSTGKITVTNPAGSGTSSGNFTPIRYVGAQLAGGTSHSCAVLTGGAVRCWGLNTNGQLGDGTTTQRTTSVQVSGLNAASSSSTATTVTAGGAFSCAALDPAVGRGAVCWGLNTNGQLGNGTTTQSLVPVGVTLANFSNIQGVTQLAAGTSHACALLSEGTVYCWGLNTNGQLGDSTIASKPRAVQVVGPGSDAALLNVTQIAARGSTTCALSGGGVYCWGLNTNGQLGNGTTTSSPRPVQVSGLASGVAAITVGASHACAVLSGGGAKCWGLNTSRQLGDGTTTQRITPVDVKIDANTSLGGVTGIAAGAAFTCALLTGTVRCWGLNTSGQLGNGTTTAPTGYLSAVEVLPVSGTGALSGVTAIAAGGTHMLALAGGSYDGVAWGLNTNGQLGNNTVVTASRPTYVIGY